MMRVPSEYTIAWYFLRYGKDFGGMLSDDTLLRKMVDEGVSVSIMSFANTREALKQMSEKEILDFKEKLAVYGLIFI